MSIAGVFSNMRTFLQQFEISMFNLGAWDETTFFPKWKGVFWSLVEWPWCSQMSDPKKYGVVECFSKVAPP